jgi:hypothetical protein
MRGETKFFGVPPDVFDAIAVRLGPLGVPGSVGSIQWLSLYLSKDGVAEDSGDGVHEVVWFKA